MRLAAAMVGAGVLLAAGCGGSSSSTPVEPAANSLESLWRAPGEDVAVVPGGSDFAPGPIRFTFLVVDGQGRLVTRPTARFWVARRLKAEPFASLTAHSERIGVGKAAPGEASAYFVADFDLDKPGKYWVLAEPVGGRKIQAIGDLVVRPRTEAPDVGDQAPASNTPTLANASLKELTTSDKPDPALYRTSIADSIHAKRPFVVVFATPKYCTSRLCGPAVDVISALRRKPVASGLTFDHVEIYRDNDPAKGENRWVKQWKLPSEPWVFFVGRDGRVKERFEGPASLRELEAAVRRFRA